ncbi:hypothetical protein [Pseudarcicella hirudinis]|nr:hypothetical protein [Pseudarcicella hirudinis]
MMKISEIQQLSESFQALTPEQKMLLKESFMKSLAEIDNLGEMDEETSRQIKGGTDLTKWFLGFFLNSNQA